MDADETRHNSVKSQPRKTRWVAASRRRCGQPVSDARRSTMTSPEEVAVVAAVSSRLSSRRRRPGDVTSRPSDRSRRQKPETSPHQNPHHHHHHQGNPTPSAFTQVPGQPPTKPESNSKAAHQPTKLGNKTTRLTVAAFWVVFVLFFLFWLFLVAPSASAGALSPSFCACLSGRLDWPTGAHPPEEKGESRT